MILAFCSIATYPVKSQFRENIRRSLFADQKAYDINDAIMIIVVEDTKADNSATTTESSDTELGGGVDLNTGTSPTSIDLDLSTENSFRGKGQNTRSEQLRARLSAKVIAVEENGNLRIEGVRTTKINGETQTITIQGIVRPVDIRSDNSIYSYNIMDMTLIYEGDGNITKAQEPGLITKFLRILF